MDWEVCEEAVETAGEELLQQDAIRSKEGEGSGEQHEGSIERRLSRARRWKA